MQDTNDTIYRVQVDHLILEATVNVAEHGGHDISRPMTCTVHLHLDTDANGEGLKTEISRGQLVVLLQFWQAIWVQVGGMGKFGPTDWKEVR